MSRVFELFAIGFIAALVASPIVDHLIKILNQGFGQ